MAIEGVTSFLRLRDVTHIFMKTYGTQSNYWRDFFSVMTECWMKLKTIVANRKLASTNKPVAFRSVHTGIEPPFLLRLYYASTACMTRGFTSRKY